MNYPNIMARVLSTPLLLEGNYASVFFSALLPRLGIDSLTTHEGVNLDATTMQDRIKAYQASDRRPYQLSDGVAIIQIDGSLTHRSAAMNPVSGSTGYDTVSANLEMAAQDPAVKGVLLDINSPGGEASGVSTVAEQIKAFSKPVIAHTGTMMASAAYWLGAAANKVYADKTSSVGSIGAVVAVSDSSSALNKAGVKVELIRFGARKMETSGVEPISAVARAGLQDHVNELGGMFAGAIANYRKLSLDEVLATEAAVFSASQAKAKGLIDGVQSLSETLTQFKKQLSASSAVQTFTQPQNVKVTKMENTQDQAEVIAKAEAELKIKEANTIGATAERSRIKAILGLNHPGANHIAFNTSMSVEDASALLSAIPVAQPETAKAEATKPVNPAFNGATLAHLAAHEVVKPEVASSGSPRMFVEPAEVMNEHGSFDLNKMVAAVAASKQASK